MSNTNHHAISLNALAENLIVKIDQTKVLASHRLQNDTKALRIRDIRAQLKTILDQK